MDFRNGLAMIPSYSDDKQYQEIQFERLLSMAESRRQAIYDAAERLRPQTKDPLTGKATTVDPKLEQGKDLAARIRARTAARLAAEKAGN